MESNKTRKNRKKHKKRTSLFQKHTPKKAPPILKKVKYESDMQTPRGENRLYKGPEGGVRENKSTVSNVKQSNTFNSSGYQQPAWASQHDLQYIQLLKDQAKKGVSYVKFLYDVNKKNNHRKY